MPRKNIVQIAIDTSNGTEFNSYIYAVCSDGTLWKMENDGREIWNEVEPVQEPEDAA